METAPSGLVDSSELRLSPGRRIPEQTQQQIVWFIRLRWAAVLIMALGIGLGGHMGILPPESLYRLWFVWGILTFSNLLFYAWYRRGGRYWTQLMVQMSSDLLIITMLLHCSGGLENPVFLIYIFHVILAGILFRPSLAWLFTGLAAGLFSFLGLAEMKGWIPHYTIEFFPHESTVSHLSHASQNPNFVLGRMGAFLGLMLFTTAFTTMIMQQLRKREQDLRKTAREARSNQQKIEEIVDAAEVGMVLLNEKCEVTWFNNRLEKWLDWDHSMIGTTCPFETVNEDGSRDCIAHRSLEEGKTAGHEFDISIDGKGRRVFYITSSPVRNEGAEIKEVVQLVQDVTHRRMMEAEVSHAAKMQLLGRLSAGIAHEIGNPLNTLKTRLNRMRRARGSNSMEQNLDFLEEQLDRIEEIVRGVSHFSQRKDQEWSRIHVNDLIRETVDLVQIDSRSDDVTLQMNLDKDEPRTIGVRNQIEQVLVNLVLNALEAMENGGTLKVGSETSRDFVRIHVEDSGPGIDADDRDRVFQPFYTTKSSGTGLGLAISESFVRAHQGSITADVSSMGGACFTVELPLRHTMGSRDEISRTTSFSFAKPSDGGPDSTNA